MINIIENKELIYDIHLYDVILVGTSINNALGNGFQYQVKKAFPEVDAANKNTPYGDLRKLGTVQVVKKYDKIFCLLYINKSRRRPDLCPDYLDYNALESCMKLINENFPNAKVVSTLLGHSVYEGDGNKEQILNIIKNNSDNLNLTIYDYEQPDYKSVLTQKWLKVIEAADNGDNELYRKLKIQYFWEKTFGVLKPIPEDMDEKQIKELIKQWKSKNC